MIYEDAEKDYVSGMKYQDIAEKYNVSINTVKSWKVRYGWIRGPGAKKCAHKKEKVCTQNEPVQQDEKIGEDGLTQRQRLFAVYYLKTHNATKSYMRVFDCTYQTAAVEAHRMLKNPKIKTFVEDRRKEQLETLMIREEDLIQKLVDIVYADPTDYVDRNGFLKDDIDDGTIIQAVIPMKGGAAVKLMDKARAIDSLAKYMQRSKKIEDEDDEIYQGVVLIPERMTDEEEDNLEPAAKTS